jgi:hypothetical protein
VSLQNLRKGTKVRVENCISPLTGVSTGIVVEAHKGWVKVDVVEPSGKVGRWEVFRDSIVEVLS